MQRDTHRSPMGPERRPAKQREHSKRLRIVVGLLLVLPFPCLCLSEGHAPGPVEQAPHAAGPVASNSNAPASPPPSSGASAGRGEAAVEPSLAPGAAQDEAKAGSSSAGGGAQGDSEASDPPDRLVRCVTTEKHWKGKKTEPSTGVTIPKDAFVRSECTWEYTLQLLFVDLWGPKGARFAREAQMVLSAADTFSVSSPYWATRATRLGKPRLAEQLREFAGAIGYYPSFPLNRRGTVVWVFRNGDRFESALLAAEQRPIVVLSHLDEWLPRETWTESYPPFEALFHLGAWYLILPGDHRVEVRKVQAGRAVRVGTIATTFPVGGAELSVHSRTGKAALLVWEKGSPLVHVFPHALRGLGRDCTARLGRRLA